jgi:hypothetical protein
MILVIIRSKVFNFQDSSVGGEAIYTLLRSLALQAVNDTRTRQRTTFLNANIGAAFAIANYFTQLENTIVAAMQMRPLELRQRAANEVKVVKTSIPPVPMSQADVGWSNCYYSMTGVCFDYCGPAVLKTFPDFQMP